MERPRDSQRQKVYNAERLWRGEYTGQRLTTVDAMQRYVDSLLAQQWTQRHFGSLVIAVSDGRGSNRGRATEIFPRYWDLAMPRFTRTESYFLHEIAHALETRDKADRRGYGPWHGWHFASVMLKLVQHQLGVEAHNTLERQYRAYKVSY